MNAPIQLNNHKDTLCRLVHLYYDRISPRCNNGVRMALDHQIVGLHKWFADEFDRQASMISLCVPQKFPVLAKQAERATALAELHRYCAKEYTGFDAEAREQCFNLFFLEAYDLYGHDVPGMGEKRLLRMQELAPSGSALTAKA